MIDDEELFSFEAVLEIALALAFAFAGAVKLKIDHFIRPAPLAVYLPVNAVHRGLSAREKRAFFPYKKKRK